MSVNYCKQIARQRLSHKKVCLGEVASSTCKKFHNIVLMNVMMVPYWKRANSGADSSRVTEAINPAVGCHYFFAVTAPATKHHLLLAGTKLYCLVTEAHVCIQLAPGLHSAARRPGFEPATCWSQVRLPNHVATEPHSVEYHSKKSLSSDAVIVRNCYRAAVQNKLAATIYPRPL